MYNKVLNKVIAFIMLITILFAPTYAYAADKVPGANASADKIATYIKNNSSNLKNIKSSTLKAWHETLSNEPSGQYSAQNAEITETAEKLLEKADNDSDIKNLMSIVGDPDLLSTKAKKNIKKYERRWLGRKLYFTCWSFG